MKKYLGQYFDNYNADKENGWLLESPLFNNNNKTRILKIWEPLVNSFKKNPPRLSPCESANIFLSGTISTGYDKKQWIVKEYNGVKKWIHYNPTEVNKLDKFVTKRKINKKSSVTTKKKINKKTSMNKTKKKTNTKLNNKKISRRKSSKIKLSSRKVGSRKLSRKTSRKSSRKPRNYFNK